MSIETYPDTFLLGSTSYSVLKVEPRRSLDQPQALYARVRCIILSSNATSIAGYLIYPAKGRLQLSIVLYNGKARRRETKEDEVGGGQFI
jgi:hypothetical protein